MPDVTRTSERKAISDPVWKELFSRSGNMCFMEGCSSLLFDLDGLKDVFIAHIKGVGAKGPRHDPQLTTLELNSIENLMLLCNRHHTLIDKMPVTEFTVERVHQMKRTHEDLVQSLSSALKDHVFDNSGEPVDTASFTFERWLSYLEFAADDMMERAVESELMRRIILVVGTLPPDARKVLSVILRRGTATKEFGNSHISIRIKLLADRARPISEDIVHSQLATLEESGLCETDDPDFFPAGAALRVATRTQGDWDPFPSIKKFCQAEVFDPSELFERDRWERLN